MCEHNISTKIENGIIISYCTKCGKIFDQRPVIWEDTKLKSESNTRTQILYD